MQNNLFSIYQNSSKEKLVIASQEPKIIRDYIESQMELARNSIQNIINSDAIKELHISKVTNLTKRIATYKQWLQDIDYTTMNEKGKSLEFFLQNK